MFIFCAELSVDDDGSDELFTNILSKQKIYIYQNNIWDR